MKGIKSHKLICVWALASIVYAFIIHCLFSYYPDNQWFVAKWTAGEILTYVSTVSLGLLAVWQNQRLQEENDKSQLRLENLVKNANELSIVSKVIEIESNRLERLKDSLDEFSKACDPQTISVAYADSSENIAKIMQAMVVLEHNLDDSFWGVGRELRLDKKLRKDDTQPIKMSYVCYYRRAKEIITSFINNPIKDNSKELEVLSKCRDDFAEKRENYLVEQENKLYNVLYGNMTLEDIKKLYNV
jgi:hypothetical protein